MAPTTFDDKFIGHCLHSIRRERNTTQKELSSRTGFSITKLRNYEYGNNTITAPDLWILAQSLDVPISAFFHGDAAHRPLRVLCQIPNKEMRDLLFELILATRLYC